jgi:arsenate reductase
LTGTGRCLCGHYTFEVDAPPLWVAYCHCESCRRATGSPAACYVGFADDAVRFEPAPPPTFASTPPVRRSFCEHCGTPLSYAAEFFPDELHLFRSNFEQPEIYEPTRHVLYNEHEADFEIYDDLPRYGTEPGEIIGWGPRPAIRVLFLCTGNSARSILAEAILNLRGASLNGRRLRAHSAGSTPVGEVNPGAMALLVSHRHRLGHIHSKSWDAFTTETAPAMDWVITLCDDAAAEACPVFPGPARKLHWGLPDPASGAATFEDTWAAIERKVDAFLDELGVRSA